MWSGCLSNKAPDRTGQGGSSTEIQPSNIGYLHKGSINWLVAHPLLLRWDGLRWAPKKAMNNRSMITPEARISRLQLWRVSKSSFRCRENHPKAPLYGL
ncbi:MAG: hypothetical protein HA492_04080 [Candidatus Verstraetearchaeota archaeon]|nr:hypothetical protein [Candidatus Verstraetearchaeota archaeon]